MGSVNVPPLVLHFDGAAPMVHKWENYFQEPKLGLMCLAVESSASISIIGNVQQQNFLVLFDVGEWKLSFATTNCEPRVDTYVMFSNPEEGRSRAQQW